LRGVRELHTHQQNCIAANIASIASALAGLGGTGISGMPEVRGGTRRRETAKNKGESMTVKEIIIEKIAATGADGLCHIDTACGCGDHIDGLCLGRDCLSADCELAKHYVCMGCGSNIYLPIEAKVDDYFCEECGVCVKTGADGLLKVMKDDA